MRSIPGARVPDFFAPMMAALRLDEPQPHELLQLSEQSWTALLSLADLAHLTLPLLFPLRGRLPVWVQQRVEQNLDDNRKRRRRITDAYREIAETFFLASVDHAVIKGFSLYPDFAPSLDLRMQSDIDLYCTRASLPWAQRGLRGLGYAADRTLEGYPADHVPEMTRRRGWQWRGNHYDPEMPPAVDLHFCFWNETETHVAVPGVEAFWHRRERREIADLAFPALHPVDNLAYNALHVLRDLMRGDWVLHHVYEIACFLHTRAEDAAFWREWTQLHNPQLRRLQAISFALARRWFGCHCNKVVAWHIDDLEAPVRQWLERFSHSPLTGMFVPNKDGLWLHLALVSGGQDKLQILKRNLVPLRLPRLGAAGQGASKTRQSRRFWPSQPHLRYLLHIVFRFAFHLKLVPLTLWHGVDWWYAQWRLSRAL